MKKYQVTTVSGSHVTFEATTFNLNSQGGLTFFNESGTVGLVASNDWLRVAEEGVIMRQVSIQQRKKVFSEWSKLFSEVAQEVLLPDQFELLSNRLELRLEAWAELQIESDSE